MSFDFAAKKQALLDDYIAMAKNPATKAHAWHMVKQWADKHPNEYGDLPARLTAAMTESK